MALIVETGAGMADAESYVSVEDADAYHLVRGNLAWTGEAAAKEAALRRGTAFVDARYRGRFPGYRLNGRDQALQWPRSNAYDIDGEPVPNDEVPQEVVEATCEAALRELVEPGSLMPDLERGGGVRRLKAGSVEIEYSGSASNQTVFTAIDAILAGLLGAPAATFTGTTVRG